MTFYSVCKSTYSGVQGWGFQTILATGKGKTWPAIQQDFFETHSGRQARQWCKNGEIQGQNKDSNTDANVYYEIQHEKKITWKRRSKLINLKDRIEIDLNSQILQAK